MTRPKWISLTKSQILLADRLQPITNDWLRAYRFAWQSLIEQLADSLIVARTADKLSYFCEFKSSTETVAVALAEGDVIPATFWIYYTKARADTSQLAALRHKVPFAEHDGEVFRFAIDGLKSEGILRGTVGAVEVPQTTAGLPSRRGRPRGTTQHDDAAVISKARAFMVQRRCTAHFAATQLAHEMPGNAGEARKIRRLYDALRQT